MGRNSCGLPFNGLGTGLQTKVFEICYRKEKGGALEVGRASCGLRCDWLGTGLFALITFVLNDL